MDADKMKKLMGKKGKGKKLSENEIKAKMAVLEDIRDRAMNALGTKLKKVTVASDTEEGLEKGLDMAKKIAKGKMELGKEDDSDENEEENEDEE